MPAHPAAALLSLCLDDAFATLERGAHAAASSPHNSRRLPTPAQCIAGNYKLGEAAWQGLAIKIENPRGTTRSGTDPNGKAWSNTMAAHYGYFAGTRGADGDAVDVFLGPVPESSAAWVINQADAAGGFDEHKVLAGFVTEEQAVTAYRNSYDRGWNRIRSVVRLTVDQLRWWLKWADTRRELSLDLVPPAGTQESSLMDSTATRPELTRVRWNSDALPRFTDLAHVLYDLRRHDGAEGLLLDAVTMADIREGATVAVLDALVVQAGKLQPKMEALMKVMAAAGGAVTPVALQLSDPLKRNGGVHVAALFELSDGQTVTIWLHNPDMTPAKFSPADDLVSWKWMLNKKDITIVVAAESGQDLNPREVARRVMKLAEKNSAAFQRANVARAARMQEIEDLKGQLATGQARLASLNEQIAAAKIAKEERDARPAPAFDPVSPDGYAQVRESETLALQYQDQLDAFFHARVVAVRDALRELGWQGENFGALSKEQYTLDWRFKQVGAGRSVVGYYVRVMDGADVQAEIGDRLDGTPRDVAAQIDAVVTNSGAVPATGNTDPQPPQPDPEPSPTPEPEPAPEPEPPAERPEVAFLREVLAGGHDALALGDLLDQIEANVKALNEADALSGDADATANGAITHWVELDEKANG